MHVCAKPSAYLFGLRSRNDVSRGHGMHTVPRASICLRSWSVPVQVEDPEGQRFLPLARSPLCRRTGSEHHENTPTASCVSFLAPPCSVCVSEILKFRIACAHLTPLIARKDPTYPLTTLKALRRAGIYPGPHTPWRIKLPREFLWWGISLACSRPCVRSPAQQTI